MSIHLTSPAFRWTDESWGAALRCTPLERVASHLFTTRQLELSDEAAERRLTEAVGAARLVMLTQVHGRDAVAIRDDGALPGRTVKGDVLVSNRTDVAVAIRTADCVPLLIGDRLTGAVAAVHAGWRGTAAGAATEAVARLVREFDSRPSDLVAAIGPCIGPCCYEVGSDVVDAFAAAGHRRSLIDRWFVARPPVSGAPPPPVRLDLAGANRDQLVLAGVPEECIYASGLCTAMHLDVLTSYRAERELAGRLVAAICTRVSVPD